MIPPALRQKNGYRVFTEVHVEQFKLARLALRAEVTQNGLRKRAIEIIKVSATGDYDRAIELTWSYLGQVRKEQRNAEEAIEITEELLSDSSPEACPVHLLRQEAADYLEVTIDTLRNWEMNGLLRVKRMKNGYRVYNHEDVQRLKLIRSLRCANYSLSAILRLLQVLADTSEVDVRGRWTPPKTQKILSRFATACSLH